MSFTRWFVYASFATGVIALSLQLSGMAQATPSPIVLVANQSSTSSQEVQRDFRSKTRTADAESSGKMQSEKDALSGGGNMDPNSRSDGKSSRGQGSEVAPGSANPGAPGSSGSSPSSRPSNMGGGPESSGAGTNAGPR